MELGSSFLVHQSISSSYIQQHSLATLSPIPSILPIRSTIIQPLSRPFRQFFLYAAQSSRHSLAHSVNSSYSCTIIQPLSRPFRQFFLYAVQSSSHSHVHSVNSSYTQQIIQLLSRPFRQFFLYAVQSSSHSLAHSVNSSYTQQIIQALSRPFRQFFLYAANHPGTLSPIPSIFPIRSKSSSHSLAHSVNSSYTQHSHPATLSPIPSLVSISNKSNQPPSCQVLSFPVLRQRVKFRSMQYLMLSQLSPLAKLK